MNKNIVILEGDITAAPVDAIVNAANPIMLGGGGVDGAIHRAAGPKLLEECQMIKSVNGIRCPIGEAKITPAGALIARYVIHTVGPRYKVDKSPGTLLASAYEKSLGLALSNHCTSIAFPAISCGAYGYPAEEAARLALKVCCSDKYNDLEIFFYLYGEKMKKIWEYALNELIVV